MILILLGTQNKPFNRLLKAISREIKNGNIKDKVVAQIGCTVYKDENIDMFDYKPKEEINELINNANIIITHGGVGTIIECLNLGKKVIVAPRLNKYKEHTNNHQLQITKEFYEKGYILPLYKFSDLADVLLQIKKFKPKKYESNNENFASKIKEYIDNL